MKWPERLSGERAPVPVDAGLGVDERDSGGEHVSSATPSQEQEPPNYHRVSEEEAETILRLHELGETQTTIAEQLGRNISTISRTIQKYQPTVHLAKGRIANTAVRAVETAENLLRAESEKVRLDAAALFLRANNLAGDGKQASVGIQINLGSPGGSPLPTVQVIEAEQVAG